MKPASNEYTLDKLIGLYWYCSDYHSGMSSWEYRVLSNSRYKPAMSTSSIYDEDSYQALVYYEKLVKKFQTWDSDRLDEEIEGHLQGLFDS